MAQDTKEVRTKFTTLYIDPTVMKRIMYYTQAADGEVSGLGTLIKDEKGRHVVNRVFLLEQESSGADTELNSEAISKLMTTMIGKNEDPATLKFWWHSHANMGVFWSGTDDTCAETLSREFAFSLVVNKAREMRCRLDLYAPFRITFDGVKVTELVQEDQNLREECEKEVKEKVKSPGEKWKNWNDKDHFQHNDYGYPGYYGEHFGGKDYGQPKPYSLRPETRIDGRVKLSEVVVADIERLIDGAEKNSTDGGIFSKDTWNEYIRDTLKEVVEARLDRKASCKSSLTWDKNYPDCIDKCKVKKACAFWTKFFDEDEVDAQAELEELNKDVPDEKSVIIV